MWTGQRLRGIKEGNADDEIENNKHDILLHLKEKIHKYRWCSPPGTYNHVIMTSPVNMSSLIFSVTSCCHISNYVKILLKSAATVRIVSKKGHQMLTNVEDLLMNLCGLIKSRECNKIDLLL